MTHANAPETARSRSASIALAGAGVRRMAGATMTRAPRVRSSSTNTSACARGRVTRTVRPSSVASISGLPLQLAEDLGGSAAEKCMSRFFRGAARR